MVGHQYIFMLNCGGSIDLEKTFNLTADQFAVVIDSHRPFNLSNLWAKQVILYDDGPVITSVKKKSDLDIDPYASAEDEEEEDMSARERIKEYYRKNWFGTPCCKIVFDISRRMNKKNNNHLWLCIIGITEQFLFEKISPERYKELYEIVKGEVKSLNNEKDSKMEVEDGMEIKVGSDERILHVSDYKFPLYRHWNIYDSMLHSPFVSSRLFVWNERGRSRMKSFLAQMGIPLEECQQNFASMKLKYKEEMPKKLKRYAKHYSLEDVFFDSFYKNFGITYAATASDMVYALTALLEKSKKPDWEDFWKAYAAVSFNKESVTIIKEGIKHAITLQQTISQQVIAIIERKSIINSAEFRLANLVGSSDDVLFFTPSGISKLGIYLMETCRIRYTKAKSLIVCAENKETKSTVIFGLSCKQKNEFGMAFKKAALHMKIEFKHASLEPNIIEMNSDYVKQFIDTVHYVFKSDTLDTIEEDEQDVE